MKNLIVGLLAATFLSTSFAVDFLDLSLEDKKSLARTSHWDFRLGYSLLSLPVEMKGYSGIHKNYKSEQNRDLSGTSLEIGRNFALTDRVSLGVMVGGIYHRNFNNISGKASKEYDFDLTEVEDDIEIYSTRAEINFGYTFYTRWMDLKPYLFAGAGRGEISIDRRYEFNGEDLEAESESYKGELEEEFTLFDYGIGLHFVSESRLSSYLKYTVLNLEVDEKRATYLIDGERISESSQGDTQQAQSLTFGVSYAF